MTEQIASEWNGFLEIFRTSCDSNSPTTNLAYILSPEVPSEVRRISRIAITVIRNTMLSNRTDDVETEPILRSVPCFSQSRLTERNESRVRIIVVTAESKFHAFKMQQVLLSGRESNHLAQMTVENSE